MGILQERPRIAVASTGSSTFESAHGSCRRAVSHWAWAKTLKKSFVPCPAPRRCRAALASRAAPEPADSEGRKIEEIRFGCGSGEIGARTAIFSSFLNPLPEIHLSSNTRWLRTTQRRKYYLFKAEEGELSDKRVISQLEPGFNFFLAHLPLSNHICPNDLS